MSKKILSLVLSVSMCLTMLCVSALSVGAKSIEDDSCKEGETVAVLKTNYGDIAIKFFDDIAPKACENFIGLAKDGKYDNTIFHRVISDFMIQGGDFENFDGTGGTSIWNKDFENEVDDDFSNIRGAVAMANSGPDTNGSQFYINAVDNTYLDGDYTVFGFVVSGMDVVDMIEGVSTDDNDKPLNDVSLNTVEVTKYSEDLISSLSVASN
ncbi:MAG: peptidylprolyl isomerase, partial [Acutalibacteraceae bacterium]